MPDRVLDSAGINRYLDLVSRRLYILLHSGIDWRPEYGRELEEIDKEILSYRQLIDAVHG